MQYVIISNQATYYCGPNKDYVYRMGHWTNSLDKATVFTSLKEAKDIFKNVKNDYLSNSFCIVEYNPPTLGKVVIHEKETVLNNLRFVRDSVLNPDSYYRDLITTAIDYIKENVND